MTVERPICIQGTRYKCKSVKTILRALAQIDNQVRRHSKKVKPSSLDFIGGDYA